jgi:hypothetical protein
MPFQVKTKPRIWRVVALFVGTLLSLAGLFWGVVSFAEGNTLDGLLLLLLAPLTGGLSAWIGRSAYSDWRQPRSIRVENDAIQLIVREQTCGQIPFANVAMIRNLWDQDDRPFWDRTLALTQLAGVFMTLLIGVAETWWFWMFADRTREKSRGVVIVLKDAEDTNTWWPASGFKKHKKQIHIKGAWELRFPEIVTRLREEELIYLQARGLVQLAADSENPFEFKR